MFSVGYVKRLSFEWQRLQRGPLQLLLLSLLTPCPLWLYSQSPSPTPIEKTNGELFKKVIANQKKAEEALDIYERVQRVEMRRAGGNYSSPEIKVWRVFPAGPATDKIPLTAEGNPVTPASYRTELEKLEKYLVWAVQQSPVQREAYAKAERKRKDRNELIAETHEAFVFTRVSEETRGEHVLAKYSMTPNPKFKPTSRNAVIFTKVRGFVWVDEESAELARIEGSVTEDISLALFVAKVYKGSSFMQERYEIEPGVWLPTFEQYDFDGRKYLMPFSIHERTFYTKYRRVGPPKESVELVRAELSKSESGKDE